MKTVLNRQRIGIMIGQVGIGLISFPWVNTFEQKYSEISFWEFFFCPPRICFSCTRFKKYVQLRVLWFVIHVET